MADTDTKKPEAWERELWDPEVFRFVERLPYIYAGSIILMTAYMWFIEGRIIGGILALLFLGVLEIVEVQSTDVPRYGLLVILGRLANGYLEPRLHLRFRWVSRIQMLDRPYRELTFNFKKIVSKLSSDALAAMKTGVSRAGQLIGSTFNVSVGFALEPNQKLPIPYYLAGGASLSKNNDEDTNTDLDDLLKNNIYQTLQEFGQRNSVESVNKANRKLLAILILVKLGAEKVLELDDGDEASKIYDQIGKAALVEHLYDANLGEKPTYPENATEDEKKAIDKKYNHEEQLAVKEFAERCYDKNVAPPDAKVSLPKWGVNIIQFKITAILPPDKILERAEEIEEENLIERREKRERRTLKDLARDIYEDSRDEKGVPSLTKAQALHEAKVQKGIVKEEIQRHVIDGLDGVAEKLAEGLSNFGRRN